MSDALEEYQQASNEIHEMPTPRFSGTFSVYDTPDGGIHIAWRPSDGDASDTQHIDIPGAIVGIMKRVQNGESFNPIDLLKSMMAGKVPEIG